MKPTQRTQRISVPSVFSARIGAALLAAALLLTTPAPAAARELVIEDFHAEVTINADGTVDVTEIIRARFTGQWNGIYRTIPVEYRTPLGLNYTLRLSLTSITDENGASLTYEVSRQRHYRKFKVWVPGARDATRTIRIQYRVRNALRFFDEHDEFYWNVTGDEWGVPIESASATVTLPSEVAGLRASAFTGAYGSTGQDAGIETGDSSVRVRTRRKLNIREGLTVAVAWDKGLVEEPGALAKIAEFLYSNWPFFFPIGVFVLMFWLWHTRGRDPRVGSIVPRYEPPEGLSPSEVGTLIDNRPDLRDITAIIVDLAVRGYLTIEETKESKWLGLTTGTEYVFHRARERSEWDELLPHEKDMMIEMFDGGARASVEMSELTNNFYKALPGIHDSIFARLMAKNYYDHRPDTVQQKYIGIGMALGLLSVVTGQFLSISLGISQLTFLIAGIASGIIIAGFGAIMPARTLAGTRALEGVLGFEEFLSRVEKHRYQTMIKTPEMFEKFLPYAMALGVEAKWAKEFDDIYTEAPSWYRGYHYGPHFYLHGFTHNLSAMGSSVGTAMASSPRSSGGSGFGGGGFSGGGFGGGGGGGPSATALSQRRSQRRSQRVRR